MGVEENIKSYNETFRILREAQNNKKQFSNFKKYDIV